MKKSWKKWIALGMAATLSFSMLGCGSGSNNNSTVTEDVNNSGKTGEETDTNAEGDSGISADSPYADKEYDLSQQVNIVMYALGDAPADMAAVLEKANNEYFIPNLNATLDVKFLNWSDYNTKYSLLLTGGEQVDLLYTAAWCYYHEEVEKGAFKEFTMDWIKQYMPYTYESQPSESWDQIAIDGKIYAIPKAKASFTGYNIVAVRSDLIEQYKLTEPTNWDNFKTYLKELSELKSETGVTPIATNSNRDQLNTIFNQEKKLEVLASGFDWYYYNNDSEKAPSADDIIYMYTSDEYLEYCKLCAELAQEGAWSSDAISDTGDAQAYFENGTSGAFVWNSSVYTAGKNLEASKLGTYAVYDITPDTLRRRASYADDAIAIPVNSKNPERAALVLDYIKNNVDLNRLLLGGIEGTHYQLNSEGYRETMETSDNYPWNGWAWALNRQDEPDEAGKDERELEMDAKIEAKEYHPETAGFTFDSSTVSSEFAVVNSIRDEYIGSFSLGVFGDKTEETFQNFKKKLESAGVEKINEEMKRQYNEYLTDKGYN